MFNIVERFITLSGEAPIIGKPVYLIRFSNCNLSCKYCDTTYNNEVNETISLYDLKKDILSKTDAYKGLSVLLTGGEPLQGERQKLIIELIKSLPDIDFYIETNGSIELVDFSLQNIHYVADWKSPSSGENSSFYFDNLKKYRPEFDCIKLVVNNDDLSWLNSIVDEIKIINPNLPVYVSVQANSLSLENLADFILKNKLPVALSIQLHKIIWGDGRGV